MKKFLLFIFVLVVAFSLVTRFIYYQNTEKTPAPPPFPCRVEEGTEPAQAVYSCALLQRINEAYISEIKPILLKKCLMCHGIPDKLPLYAKIPPSSWLVNYDRRVAKKHINMSWDFPIRSHKGLLDGLEDMKDVVEEGSMPPFIYKVMHWKSGLTREEAQRILAWVQDTKKLLSLPQHSPSP